MFYYISMQAANLGIDGSNVHLVINQAEDENPRVGVQFTVKGDSNCSLLDSHMQLSLPNSSFDELEG